jgi:hypothetical protein
MNPTSGVIGEAWGVYKAHWQHLLTLAFVVYVAVALIGALLALTLTWVGVILAALVSLVALFWLQASLVKAVDDVRDGQADLSLGATFSAAQNHLGPVIVAGILAAIGVTIGLILLIVPGLILLTWWCLIVPTIVLENRSAGDSFSRSRELVKGHAWSVFGVIVLVVLLLLGFQIVLSIILSPLADWLRGFVSNIVSGTLTAPFIAIVLTLLYFRLRDAKGQGAVPVPAAETPAPPPPPETPA